MPEDGRLEFDTSIETGGIEKDLQSIKKLIEKISKTVEAAADNIRKIVKNTQTSTSALNDTIEETDRNIDSTSNSMRGLSSSSNTAARALDNAADSAENVQDEVESLGDTSERTSNKNDEFKKSVSKISQELKVLDSEMKLVKSQYDKNDTSAEALTAQNRVLNDSIELQKQKIDVLKQALENSSEEYGKNDKKTQEWKIQLNHAEAALSNMERSLKNNNDILERNADRLNDAERQSEEFGNETEDTSEEIEDLGSQSKKTASKVENLGDKADKAEDKFSGLKNMASKLKDSLKTVAEIAGKAIIGVSTGILGAGTASTNVGMNFEAAMSKVSAISGESGESLEDLTEKAKEMGASTKFSATESAEAFQYMAMAGWDAEKMIDGIDGIMNLSAADGLDLAATSDIVTDALTAFGLSANQSTHFADVLATASSSANTNVSMLGESFKYIAPLAGAMNYSVEDVSLALGLMANASVKGSMAGTSLKTALANLAKPTKNMTKALTDLGLATIETNTEIDQLDVDKAVINQKQATEKLASAQKKYDETVQKYGEDSEEAISAALKLEAAQNSLASANEKLEEAQAGDTEQTGIFVSALQNADGTMKPLKETLIELRKAFANLDEAQQTEYASAIFGKEAMSGMLAIINSSDEDFNKLTENLTNADGAAKAMADTLNDNLKGDITIAQSALEGFGIVIYETLDDRLREAVQLGTGYIDRLSKAFSKGGLQEAVNTAGEIFGELSIKIAEYAPEIISISVDFIKSFGNTLFDLLPRTIRSPIVSVIDNIKDTLSGVGDIFIHAFSGEDIKSAVIFSVNLIGDFSNTILNVIKEILPAFENAVRTMKRAFESNGFNSGVKVAKDIFKAFGDIVASISKTVLTVASGVIEKIANHLDVLVPLALGAVTAFKAWKIITSVISWGNSLSATVQLLTVNVTAQSIAEDVARMKTEGATAAMGLQQIAASLLTGKITLQEAATWLATKAQTAFNAVLAANPVVLVTAAVAGLVAGLAVLVTWLAATQGSAKEYNEAVDRMNESGEKAKESAEEFGKALNGIGDGADDFVESINNSKSALDGIDDSVILNTQKMDELQKNMEEVQTGITKITGFYSDERKKYTEEEIQTLDNLFKKELDLVEQKLQEMSTYQTVASESAKLFVGDFDGTAEEYAEESKKYIKAAQDAKDKVVTAAEEQYNKQLAQITLMKGLSEKDRKQKEDAAKKVYNHAIESANKEYSDTMAIITDGYNARSNAAADFQHKLDSYHKDYKKLMDEHHDNIQKINKTYANDQRQHDIELANEQDRYNHKISDLLKEHTKNFDSSTQEEISVWLGFVKSVKENGGQITQETANVCQNIIDQLSILPPESKAEMQSTIGTIQEVMNDLPPAMRKKAEETSNAWLNEQAKLPSLARSSTNDVRNAIIDELGEIPEACRPMANEMVTTFANQIKSPQNINEVKNAAAEIKKSITGEFNSSDWYKMSEDLINGFAFGVQDNVNLSQKAGFLMTSLAVKGGKEGQQSNSPSKATRKLGHDFSDGFALGIEDNQNEAKQKASSLAKNSLLSIAEKIKNTVLKAKMVVGGRFNGMEDNGFTGSDILARLKTAAAVQSANISAALVSGKVPSDISGMNESTSVRASGNIETHIHIDGREFAVATVPYIDEELAFFKG